MNIQDTLKELKSLADYYAKMGQPQVSEAYRRAAYLLENLQDQLLPDPKILLPDKNGSISLVLPVIRCKRCGFEWTPRKGNVRRCPSCKSLYWNIDPNTSQAITPSGLEPHVPRRGRPPKKFIPPADR